MQLRVGAGLDEMEVVDPCRRWGRLDAGFGAGGGMGVTADHDGHGRAHRPVRPAGLDTGQVERVKDQLDASADEGGVNLVGVGEQAHRRGLSHRPGLGPQERLVQLLGGGVAGQASGAEPLEWGLFGLGVDSAVIDRLHPGGEELVEAGDVVDLGVGDLDEELVAHGAEHPLDLAPPLRAARTGMDHADPEAGARPQQLGGHKRAAVVQIHGVGDAPRSEPGTQGCFGADGVFGRHPPIPGEQPGVVVQECEQDRLVTADDRAVQRVADPQLVGPGRLEPAEDNFGGGQGPSGHPDPTEVALDRALVWRPPQRDRQDLADLGCGPLRALTLERLGQVEHLGRDPQRRGPSGRLEGLEPAPPPRHDPVIQRRAGHPQLRTARAGVHPGRQLAHQPAPLRLRQRRISGLPDQRITKQAHLGGSISHRIFLPRAVPPASSGKS